MPALERSFQKAVKKPLAALTVGLGVGFFTLLIHWSEFLTVAELKTLDHRFRHYTDPSRASKEIVLVAIDEASLETFGRWPWPRDRHGYVVNFLKQAGAKAVVFDALFLEPDDNAEEFDQVFADEIQIAGNVFLSYLLQEPGQQPSEQATRDLPSSSKPDSTRILSRPQELASGHFLLEFQHAKFPLPLLTQVSQGFGFINLFPDRDGTTRRVPLLIQREATSFLQLTASVAREILDADPTLTEQGSLRFGSKQIPLTDQGHMLLNWHGTLQDQTYRTYPIGAVLQSFLDLQGNRSPLLDPALFQKKIVFVAGTAAGTYDRGVTPLSPLTAGVLIHMTALDNLLQGNPLIPAPRWVFPLTVFALCWAVSGIFMLLRRQALKLGLILGIGGSYYLLTVHAFTSHSMWLPLALPEAALALTFTVAATIEYMTEGRQRRQLRAAFDKYMAAEVVDEIMQHPDEIKLGGEKKELSVFFSDVAGFTTISERLSPDTLVELLNKYLSAMTDIILEHRGNVNKYLGDGIMAIFGAPRGEPNHATLACYAALDCQQSLSKLRREWTDQGYPDITARIGINSGELVVGNMGSQVRMEYTVMGDSVNLASRLEGANKVYQTSILIGPRTYELAQSDIEAREVDLMRVKGKKEPVTVYELLGRKGELSPSRRTVLDLYLAGLIAYKHRNFSPAHREFAKALELDPLDGPSATYLNRSEEYLTTPPPPDWDGVYELQSK